MKYPETETDTVGKATGLPNCREYRRNTCRFVSALLRYSMQKRKHENNEIKTSGRQVSPTQGDQNDCIVHHSKRIRNSISREELSAIQTQLAILSDGDGDRPIHIAVANENLKLVQKLCFLMVQNSISLDITNNLRQTALHLAVILGNLDIIKLLLRVGASPLVCDRNGNSVLHLAVKSNESKEVLPVLLSHKQVNNILNSMDYEGYSPLHYAVFKNNTNAVQILQTFGADMNKIDGKSGRTALIHAVLEQNIDMVELLLNCGACPQKVDYSGRSAFEMALQVTDAQIALLLEKHMPHSEATAVKEQVNSSVQLCAKTKRTKNRS